MTQTSANKNASTHKERGSSCSLWTTINLYGLQRRCKIFTTGSSSLGTFCTKRLLQMTTFSLHNAILSTCPTQTTTVTAFDMKIGGTWKVLAYYGDDADYLQNCGSSQHHRYILLQLRPHLIHTDVYHDTFEHSCTRNITELAAWPWTPLPHLRKEYQSHFNAGIRHYILGKWPPMSAASKFLCHNYGMFSSNAIVRKYYCLHRCSKAVCGDM